MQSKLEKLEIIGEYPLKHWDKKKPEYKLEIINDTKDIRMKAIPCSNQELGWYKEQIGELEKLGLIRRSKSRHRSASFFVNNHNEQIRNKARLVINYKILNDNTYDNAYNIPSKDHLINKIQEARSFSKFNCKSGYHQIRMHKDSVEWTAFICPNLIGNWEWLVVPFGLKNAPVYQKRMDNIFKNCSDFTIVYIDDILVFSKTAEDHKRHLTTIFRIFQEEGTVISKKKMELGKEFIKFLGIIIGKGQIEIQPHIAQKILEMPNKLEGLK